MDPKVPRLVRCSTRRRKHITWSLPLPMALMPIGPPWYADWLANLSSIGELLGVQPVRSELTYVLVGLDKEYALQNPTERWEDFYAARLAKHFATRG